MNEGSAQPVLDGLSGRTLERTLARIARLRGELKDLQRAYAEREDLPGIRTLLGALMLVPEEVEREVLRRARTLHDEPAQRPEGFRGRVGGFLNSIEQLLPAPLDVARRPHGRQIEALVGPFTELASALSPGRELIFEPGDDYEFEDALIQDLIDYSADLNVDLSQALKGLPRLTVITYPTQFDADTLLHAVVAHELGHLALDRVHSGDPVALGEGLINTSLDAQYDAFIDELRRTAEEEGRPSSGEEFEAFEQETRSRVKKWFAELACDSLALRMVGPAYLFALVDLDLPTNRWFQQRHMPGYDTHPGLAWRANRLLPAARAFFADGREGAAWEAGKSALDELQSFIPVGADEAGAAERAIIESALHELELESNITKALGLPGEYDKGKLAADLDIVWAKLEAGIPPAEHIFPRTRPGDTPPASGSYANTPVPDPWSTPMDWRSILNGAYVYWLAGKPRSSSEADYRVAPVSSTAVDDWDAFNEHVRGTIELHNIHEELQELRDKLDQLNFPERPAAPARTRRQPGGAGMVAREELTERLVDHTSGLAITPLIDARRQIGHASVDLRLGPDFVVAKRATGLATFDAARVDEIGEHIRDYQDYVRRPPGSAFYLHPHEFAIARTFEYITLPAHTAAQVTGRSSWGRLGLVIATAPLRMSRSPWNFDGDPELTITR